MLAAERRDHLLGLLTNEGKIIAKDVAADLGISEDSVRRDLRDLAAEGLCQRVYGGALPVSPAVAGYTARQAVAPDGKRKVAALAAKLIRPGGAVILDGGTTALALARALPHELPCTVITHSPTIAAALLDHPRAALSLLGGRRFKHSAVTCGAAAGEAAIERALASRAAETYVLASSEKIGTASRFRVLPWQKITGLVTDAAPDDPVLARLVCLGVEILRAG
ncbi:DeoR/GlpR family DNA-binding transcription regulator [Streptomyces sp. NEAU-H3]|uniref:DeoR/GlpR family DNA-binding transcription regulator n=1 Tax=Streptomyces sp. NEAU-H3 TaxID=2720636 RepID=UPI00143BB8F4|nr:DeoR/GlpR family DNA-binding transcription regulator [Streptomyces sp. NEAU-H3]NJA56769.1 DeoR/GlpR transcriptional regulator [Streptomyces sp. NEAU-H3]